jgi:pimeloyl-ACP methyl ester carboxylesterase
MMLRVLLSVLGLLLTLPVLALVALAMTLPITNWGIGYLLACSLAILGLIIAPWGERYPFLLIVTGVIAIALIAGIRLVLTERTKTSNVRLVTLPQGRPIRWVNTLIDEQDSLIFGEAIFHRIGGDTPQEHEQLTDALQHAYAEMKANQRIFGSPVLSTYLGLQAPAGFDVVITEPEVILQPDTAVIFLHGYMGNVTAQCWEIAQAVGRFGAVTVCPSTDWTGQWWEPKGEAILQATFQYLEAQGINKFYLGGFSNGGFGINHLASQLREIDGLRGLFLIDGIADGASLRDTGFPILIIQGAQDTRVSPEGVRQIAEAIGTLATYVEVEGDHFLIMKHPKAVQDAITDWLNNLEGNP